MYMHGVVFTVSQLPAVASYVIEQVVDRLREFNSPTGQLIVGIHVRMYSRMPTPATDLA